MPNVAARRVRRTSAAINDMLNMYAGRPQKKAVRFANEPGVTRANRQKNTRVPSLPPFPAETANQARLRAYRQGLIASDYRKAPTRKNNAPAPQKKRTWWNRVGAARTRAPALRRRVPMRFVVDGAVVATSSVTLQPGTTTADLFEAARGRRANVTTPLARRGASLNGGFTIGLRGAASWSYRSQPDNRPIGLGVSAVAVYTQRAPRRNTRKPANARAASKPRGLFGWLRR